MSGPLSIRTRHLTKEFEAGRPVLDDVTLEVRSGEFVAVLGRSGTGKSTLLRILSGLTRDFTGDVEVAERVTVAFQDSRLLPWKRVLANILLGARGADRRPDRARELLARVGLPESKARAWPRTLSGGEAQRVSLARALYPAPDLLLLDEPFGSLDALTRLSLQNLLAGLHRDLGVSVLLVTHDVEEALILADRVIVLDRGRIAVEVEVHGPRPRSRNDADLVALRASLLDDLATHR